MGVKGLERPSRFGVVFFEVCGGVFFQISREGEQEVEVGEYDRKKIETSPSSLESGENEGFQLRG